MSPFNLLSPLIRRYCVDIVFINYTAVIGVFANALPLRAHSHTFIVSPPPPLIQPSLSRKKNHSMTRRDLHALARAKRPLPSFFISFFFLRRDHARKKSMRSLAHPPQHTYSLTTKNGFSSVIPLFAPSLNLKSGSRPASPRRPRDTLGDTRSAFAPQPVSHQWDEIPGAIGGFSEERALKLSIAEAAAAQRSRPRHLVACGGSARTNGVVTARYRTWSPARTRVTVTSAPALAPRTAIYSTYPRHGAWRHDAMRRSLRWLATDIDSPYEHAATFIPLQMTTMTMIDRDDLYLTK